MNLQEKIRRILREETENGARYVSRDYSDQEYEEEYPKWRKAMVKFLGRLVDSYEEKDDTIRFVNTDDNNPKTLIIYDHKSGEIYWDYSLRNEMQETIPYGYLSRHFKYAIQDYFKEHFPQYDINRISGANIRY